MEELVNNVITLDMDEIDSYDFPLDDVFGLEVINKGIKFCFIIKFSSNNKNLICCGSGAQDRSRRTSSGKLRTPPFFDRWSWYKYFDESFIVYADPVFFHDETITLGWYVGDKNQWYLETVSDIIEKLSKNQNIFHNNILFYSNSGGGFASVCLGTLIKGSKVIIDNSQLFILNYHEGDVNNLFNILFKEFPGLSKYEIIEKIKYRLDVVELFKKHKYVPPIHYYVNLQSDDDLYEQYFLFLMELKELEFYKDNLTAFLYNDKKEKPHAPLPADITKDILKSFSQTYLYNSEESEDNNLVSHADTRNILLNNQISELKNKLNFLTNNIDANKESANEKKLEEKENNKSLKDEHIIEDNGQSNVEISQQSSDDAQNVIIFSESLDPMNIIVYDHATLTIHNDNSYMLFKGNLERTEDGSILTGNYGHLFYTPVNDEYYFDFPIVLELTVVDVNDSSKIRFQAYSNKQDVNIFFKLNELNIEKDNNVKIVYDGNAVKVFIDDVLKSTQNAIFTEKFRIGVQTFSDVAFFKYKDLMIYRLN